MSWILLIFILSSDVHSVSVVEFDDMNLCLMAEQKIDDELFEQQRGPGVIKLRMETVCVQSSFG